MLRQPIRQEQIEQIIEIYNKYPKGEISFNMLKECRRKTYLGYMDIKSAIEEYIKK